MIEVQRLDQIIGCEFWDYEVNEAEYSASGTEEIILNFSNGKEILIFIAGDGTLSVHGD